MSHIPFMYRIYAAWRIMRCHSGILFTDGDEVIQGICRGDALEMAVHMQAISEIIVHRLGYDQEHFKKRVDTAKNEYIEAESA